MRLRISSSLWQGLPFTLYLCGCFFIAKMLKILFCNVSGFFMKKNCFILSVFFFLPIIMYAQRTLENEDDVVDESRATVFLTIEDAVKSAMENNISVKDAEFALKNLETRKKYSWNSVSPTLNLAGNFVDDFENESVRLGFTGTVGLGLSTNLYTQIQGAKLNYEQGLITYEQSRRQIEPRQSPRGYRDRVLRRHRRCHRPEEFHHWRHAVRREAPGHPGVHGVPRARNPRGHRAQDQGRPGEDGHRPDEAGRRGSHL